MKEDKINRCIHIYFMLTRKGRRTHMFDDIQAARLKKGHSKIKILVKNKESPIFEYEPTKFNSTNNN